MKTGQNNRGQILLVQAIGLFIIVALFFQSVRFSDALKYKQETNLKADLVAVSVARIQAEHLQLMSAINQLMVYEMQMVYIQLVLAALTYGGSAKLLEMVINSVDNLSEFEKKLIKVTPIIMYWQLQRVARANGFEGAFMYPLWPELPVKERAIKMYQDAFKGFTNNSFIGNSDTAQTLNAILEGMDEKAPVKEDDKGQEKSNSNNIKEQLTGPENKKNPGKKVKEIYKDDELRSGTVFDDDKRENFFKAIMKKMQEVMGGPHYLDERYIDSQLTVFCFDSNKNIRVASARVTHLTIPRTNKLDDHKDNNYLNYFTKPNNHNGFQVELVAVPDYMEQLPQMKNTLGKIFKGLKKIPIDVPLTQEHFNWIQH